MINRADIVIEARRWLGTPWRHQASLRGVGSDCIGLIVGVARELGFPEAYDYAAALEYRGYGRQPDPSMLLAGCDRWLQRIGVDQIEIGDILVMKFREEPQHFALVSIDDPVYIIHAYAQARKVVENRLDVVWRSRIMRAYQFRGLA